MNKIKLMWYFKLKHQLYKDMNSLLSKLSIIKFEFVRRLII